MNATFYKKYILCSIALLLVGYAHAQSLVQYVQPMAGTAAATTKAALKHGTGLELNANTIPAVTVPFAMTQWTPQTQTTENKCMAPYYYKDSVFYGIRGSHWLSGSCTQDYGSFSIMPVAGKLKTSGYGVPFKHVDELTTPYLYRINLKDAHLSASVTATSRCGMMQFEMHKTDSLYLLIRPHSDYKEGFIRINATKGEVYGYNPVHRIYQGWGKQAGFSGYFIIKFEKAFSTSGTFNDKELFKLDSLRNEAGVGAYVGLKLSKGEKLTIRIGTSFTGLAGARKNLNAELLNFNFDAAVQQGKSVWEKALGQIKVETDKKEDKQIFYTSLYHAMQHPRLYSDEDGVYPMFSSNYQNAVLPQGSYYDDFSMWDIYRAQLPLFEILNPSLINNLVQSLILKGKQGGWMPIFPCWNSYTSEMIGDHTTSVIASAYLKGIRNYDVNEAYQVLRRNAFDIPNNHDDYVEGKGRRALDSYLKYHFIPLEDSVKDAFHKQEQVSRTLEYAYDDYALAQFAVALKKTDDYKALMNRAKYYVNVFDPSTKMARGRYADGSWIKPYHPDKKISYITEGTPRQYTFYVPHDVNGLARLMGGTSKLEQALDSLFNKNEYWHGNEPGHQIPFMYNYTASPWKTQRQVHKILAEEYSSGPGGLGGNDDAGQMSAWYVFAAIGFYPVNPVSGEYLLTSPLFNRTTIALPHGKKLEIVCYKKSASAQYIQSARWNGTPFSHNYIRYSDIMQGGKLELFLQSTPSKSWGVNAANQPKGLTQ
ncbi:glycoside hydrolase family 92 protein [Mucilaginibacter robiniae]|uniref:Glycoside hydrolase family 92 protein n=1 Tax=Mucilaginibacter robiniae TaxID=2728022 RepID=A0A7L5DZY3_9SPHI|nr:GH92 family glycosyl hydrolase [Mucilaginibacter robiniae]QJD96672.1 glycoside hydrolase family 92 protein [Mucilaginibacter robiniae]